MFSQKVKTSYSKSKVYLDLSLTKHSGDSLELTTDPLVNLNVNFIKGSSL